MSDIVAKLRFLVSLNEERNGGPYQGLAAEQCVSAMEEAANVIAALSVQPVANVGAAEAHERGIEAACKALGHEGVYINGATLRRAIDAYHAALSPVIASGEDKPDTDV